MVKYTYLVMLVACVFFIFWKGRFEERVVASALLAGSVLTAFIHATRSGDWLDPHVALLANEAAVTAVILTVAFRSKRFWPLPVAAFQLIAMLAQIISMIGENLESYAVGVTQGMWAYMQLLILVIGTWRGMDTKPGD